ncbi:triosephosphate isomerase [Natrinema pellirubrum DSM 15624]|uniref:Triosephosphate isomerase n=1 Tax=Natrinema pellirubrum (strain DSM 15624 / CIP 106293 / JCM 10476 / NCIMB 786 / 157) TaxID=797303 RepID=L0JGX7_NATP1|nr:triose-phosphate isomerase [Natrinema pellirubrum]AGB30569.1 triosephosphate isomerase [Natrinema pellirubrum DSM 15624]ELY74956.1 triosephosphate isomerase [Natrinema pellirubrum DSM 15624]
MGLEYPFFLVNFKAAEGTAGDDGLAFAETIDRVADETGRRFAVAPQPPDLRRVAERTDLLVVAQAGTPRAECGVGDLSLEAVAAAGADAVFVSHPENEVAFTALERAVDRCRELGLDSIVAVESRATTRMALAAEPDCLLFERPTDIGSDAGLIRSDPERIATFVETVADERPATRTFVGGGVRTAADVARAFECGVDATGAASAALEAADRDSWLRSIATAVPPAGSAE